MFEVLATSHRRSIFNFRLPLCSNPRITMMDEIPHLTRLLNQFIADFQPKAVLAKLNALPADTTVCFYSQALRVGS